MPNEAIIFKAGTSAITLIADLLARGRKNILVNVISAGALTELKSHLPSTMNKTVRLQV